MFVADARVVHEPRMRKRIAERDRHRVRLGLSRERLQFRRELRHVLDECANALQIGDGLRGLAALEKRARVVAERADGDERLIDFVRQAGRHLAEHGELARMDDFLLRIAQLVLGEHAFLDLLLHRHCRRALAARFLRDVVRALQGVLRP